MKHYSQLAEGIMVDLWRDFWIRDTGTGQQVAQLHDRYDDDDDDDECLFLALDTQQAMRIRQFAKYMACRLYNTFTHNLINGMIF